VLGTGALPTTGLGLGDLLADHGTVATGTGQMQGRDGTVGEALGEALGGR